MIDQLTLCKKKSLDKDLVGLFLPEGILDYFDLVSVSKLPDFYQISLEEKNLPPAGFTASQLHSKGFYETVKPAGGRFHCFSTALKRVL